MSILESIYVFLIRWDIPIYFICAVGFALNVLRLGQSRSRLRRAMFGFERETGQAMRLSAISGVLVFALLAGVVYSVNVFVAPTLPAELLLPPTPPPNIFATPLTSPTPLGEAVEGTPRSRVTPNLVATATLPGSAATVQPQITRPPDPPAAGEVFIPEGGGCTPGTNISEPRPGSTVFGTVEFIGSATDPAFGAYMLEMRGGATGNEWVDVLGGRSFIPIPNGSLGVVNLTVLENGAYDFRLTVLDTAGLPVARCTIEITINNE